MLEKRSGALCRIINREESGKRATPRWKFSPNAHVVARQIANDPDRRRRIAIAGHSTVSQAHIIVIWRDKDVGGTASLICRSDRNFDSVLVNRQGAGLGAEVPLHIV